MKYPTPPTGRGGWTGWLRPVKGCRLSCCDCDLVHEFDFRVVRTRRGHHVVFRARRNERATAAKRRSRPRTTTGVRR